MKRKKVAERYLQHAYFFSLLLLNVFVWIAFRVFRYILSAVSWHYEYAQATAQTKHPACVTVPIQSDFRLHLARI